MIGSSMRTKIVCATALKVNRIPPPKALRRGGRASTSIAVAMLGANHMISTVTNKAIPASGRMKASGDPANATAMVPSTRSPIQAGEPRNIRIAKPS